MQAAQYGHKKREKGPGKAAIWLSLTALALWVALTLAWTAGRIAALYGYNERLGQPFVIEGVAFYNPFAMLSWPEEVLSDSEADKLFQIGLAVSVLVPLALAGLIAVARKPHVYDDLHGSAHWADKKEIEGMGYLEGKGVYTGGWWDEKKKAQMYLRHDGPEQLLGEGGFRLFSRRCPAHPDQNPA